MIIPTTPVNETVIVRLIPRPAHVIWSPLFNPDEFATKVDSKEFIGIQLVLVRRTVKSVLSDTQLDIESELHSNNVHWPMEVPFLRHSKNVVSSAMHLKWIGLGQIEPLDWLEARVILGIFCAPTSVESKCLLHHTTPISSKHHINK